MAAAKPSINWRSIGVNILVRTFSMADQVPPTIAPAAAAHWDRVAPAHSPWLHEEVGRRMEDRLQWIRREPKAWADWEPVRGGLAAHALLERRYPKSECFVIESHPGRAQAATQSMVRPWWRRLAGPPLHHGAVPQGGVQMLWANMALHMAADPQALLAQWHRALAVDGFVMFSCLGPDTLQELRKLYQSLGWPAPSHEFTDMHDWGDMLAGAGFAEPVMDMERITLTFETPQRLLEELRGLGRNLHSQRFPGLRGRQWREQLHQALGGAPLQLTFEIIYGHAFKPRPRLSIRPETVLSLAEMRETLNQRKSYSKNP